MPRTARLYLTHWILAAKQHEVVITLVATFLLFMVVGAVWSIRRREKANSTNERLIHLLQSLMPSNVLEKNFDYVVDAISEIVLAPYYSVYVKDIRSNRYVLRATRHPYNQFEDVSPSYSGLSLPKHEPYVPPRIIEPVESSMSVFKLQEGDIPVIELRTWGMSCIVRISQVEQATRRQFRELRWLIKGVEANLDALIDLETEREHVKAVRAADDAVKRVATIASDVTVAIEVMVTAFSTVVDGLGGIFIPQGDSSEMKLSHIGVYGTKMVRNIAGQIERVQLIKQSILTLIGEDRYRVIQRSQPEFYQLPSFLTNSDVGAVAIMSIRDRGMLIFLYGSNFDSESFEQEGALQIGLLSEQLSEIASYQYAQQRLVRSYARVLWQLADVIDSMNTFTVGYSEMMSRYALVIGRNLDLSDDELRDLALAAHLSNIGVLGVDMDIVTKRGEYSAFESTNMQMHAQLGASMIQIATGNEEASKYVLYHHERVDGMGFPSGLRGSDIPIGAKILHVVQVFLAKINGRAWREPEPFEDAIRTLKVASGSQLDEEVVDAFIDWFERKQRRQVPSKSLSSCQEMLCVPQSICDTCPVSKRPEVNCWEVEEGNQCHAHGRKCSTCFVRTEAEYRRMRA